MGIVVGAMLAPSLPVSAIGNPNSIDVLEAMFFRNTFTTGDQLLVVRYDLEYSVTPAEDPRDTWLVVLFDTDGVTPLYQRPLNYYGHNVISIYLTAEQNITWGGEYYVKVMGQPTIFGPYVEDVNGDTKVLSASLDYDSSTNLESSRIALGEFIINQAEILEVDFGVPLVGTGDKLNAAGAVTFNAAIPGLSSIASTIYETAIVTPSLTPGSRVLGILSTNISGTFVDSENVTGLTSGLVGTYLAASQTATLVKVTTNGSQLFTVGELVQGASANITVDSILVGELAIEAYYRMGTRLRNAIDGLGAWLGMSGNTFGGVLIIGFYFLCTGLIFSTTGNVNGGIVLGFPIIFLGNYLGLIPIVVTWVAGMLILGLFAILFWMGRLA